MMFPSLMTSTLGLLNWTLQSASHSTGTDNKFFVIDGNMCAVLAAGGRFGIGSCLDAVDVIAVSFAQITLTGLWSMSFPGQFSVK